MSSISRRQVSNIKKTALVLEWGRKFIYLENFEQRSLSCLILTITTTPDIRYKIGRMQRITELSSNSVIPHCVNGAESLDFVVSGAVKKCKYFNHLMHSLNGTIILQKWKNKIYIFFQNETWCNANYTT